MNDVSTAFDDVDRPLRSTHSHTHSAADDETANKLHGGSDEEGYGGNSSTTYYPAPFPTLYTHHDLSHRLSQTPIDGRGKFYPQRQTREMHTYTHLIGFPSLLLTPPCYHVSFLHVYSNSAGSSRTHAVHRLTLFSLFKIAFLITFQLFISSLHTRTLAATATRQAACTLSRLRTRSGASRYASSSDPAHPASSSRVRKSYPRIGNGDMLHLRSLRSR